MGYLMHCGICEIRVYCKQGSRTYLTNWLWAHNCNLVKYDSKVQIRSNFFLHICRGVMACAWLWPDSIIISGSIISFHVKEHIYLWDLDYEPMNHLWNGCLFHKRFSTWNPNVTKIFIYLWISSSRPCWDNNGSIKPTLAQPFLLHEISCKHIFPKFEIKFVASLWNSPLNPKQLWWIGVRELQLQCITNHIALLSYQSTNLKDKTN